MSGQTNTLGGAPSPVVVAFYTTGDTRAATGSTMSVSDAFRQRATLVASPGFVFGVPTASDATAKIRLIAATQPISKVYFVGHGNANVFFFDGVPDGTDNFKSVITDGILVNPGAVHSPMDPDSLDGSSSKSLINELAKHLSLSSTPVEIGFLCCNSGSTLVGTVAAALSGQHLTGGTVGGYNNDYRTNYVASKPKEPPSASWWTGPGWYDIIQTDDAQKKMIKRGSNNAIPTYDTASGITP